MYKAANVPQNFSVRQDGKKTCKTDITDDLTTAKSARMEVATWNGIFTAEVGINQKKISGSLGENHNVSYNSIEVPLSYLIKGTNFWYIYSKTTTHGAEFSWPGMALKVQYDKTK